jgi:hypothetical protein
MSINWSILTAVLCVFLALCLVRMFVALNAARKFVKLDEVPSFYFNHMMGGSEARGSNYDHVDPKGWTAVSSFELWGKLALLSLLALAAIAIFT